MTRAAVSGWLRLGCHSPQSSGCTAARQCSGDALRPAQNGHPDRCRTRLLTEARHSCARSCRHCHQIRRPEPATTSRGESSWFRVGCHSATSCGCVAASELSLQTRKPRQNGHAPPRLSRSCGDADHWWCGVKSHLHHAGRVEPATTRSGRSAWLRVGCHCAARSGRRVVRLLVAEIWRPAQHGHPVPPHVRLFGLACHSWSGPRWHFHQTFRPEPCDTSLGSSPLLRVGCHCSRSSGHPFTQLWEPRACWEGRSRVVAPADRGALTIDALPAGKGVATPCDGTGGAPGPSVARSPAAAPLRFICRQALSTTRAMHTLRI